MAKKWTKEEEKMLSKIHHMYTNAELAEIFGVSVQGIYDKKRSLGLTNEKLKVTEGYKKCCTCNTILPVSEFYKETAAKDGFQAKCITCKNEYKRKAKIDLKNKAENIERDEKIKKYIEKIKDKSLFCESCNEDKKIEDYYIYAKKNGTVFKMCIKCKNRKNFNNKIKRIKEIGY